MFENLSEKLNSVFASLTSKGILTEEDIAKAMREIRIALLEADVALPVVKDFITNIKEQALGAEIIKSVKPGHMVIKIVQDELVKTLGSERQEINLKSSPPAIIMMVGLQGSGKTTSSAKLALVLKSKLKKKILMSSLDIYRPAAQHQLEVLGKQIDVATVPIINNEKPIEIAKRSIDKAKKEAFDILILDTAGRLHIDEHLMKELEEVKKIANPVEILLVADSLTGQDAINIAKQFNERLSITGIILTRLDGDSRGGAALSMKFSTSCPIKYVGVGEKMNEFEEFHPQRVASRILGMGDIVSLVEKVASNIEIEDAEKLSKKMAAGNFNLNDMLKQLRSIKKMGGLGSIMNMIPGMSKISGKLEELNVEDKIFKKQEAIILSMTKQERINPKIINASRKQRIAKGSGTTAQDINILLKQFLQMQNMMKKFKNFDKKSLMRGGINNLKNMLQ